ncbi:MAG: MBL fold metallo-hydrolase [Deltaproteobacteria bacterium]|nr:MBL fold metallo-hydrolase [Deltaproteobacteria bacterium]
MHPKIEEILPNFHRAEIPLPDSPLKFVNSYFIKGEPRNLIVDTGLNRDECRAALGECIRSLGFDLAATDLFITHAHADHVGLAKELATAHSKVFLNAADAALLREWSGWEALFPLGATHGFPAEELRLGSRGDPNMAFREDAVPEVTVLEEGKVFSVGEYRLQSLSTPGHSAGHTCLYEPERKLLLSGDHILGEISPNITSWRGMNTLKQYLASLEAVERMDVERVLPGHRSPFGDHRRRIRELKAHHEHRLNEVRSLVSRRARTAYDLASEMTWDLGGSWGRWAFTQRWFATGEALSHLRYLEEEGAVVRTSADGVVFFAGS